MFENGFFCGLFDFDDDGKLNAIEKAADLGAFVQMVEEAEKEGKEENEDDE